MFRKLVLLPKCSGMQLCPAYLAVNLVLARHKDFPWSSTGHINAVTYTITAITRNIPVVLLEP